MKLVIFGLTVTSSWGNGHATLWRGLLRAMAALGHDIVFFERDVPYYASNRDLVRTPEYRIELYSDWTEGRERARRALVDADAAIVTSYCPDALAVTELLQSRRDVLKVFYDLDTPVTLDQLRRHGKVEYVPGEGLGMFDLVLSYTGGPALTELSATLGARHVAPLYGSVDPAIHKPVPGLPEYQADLSYLGTYAEDRQPALQHLFIEPARRLPERRFVLGGAQYPQDFPWTGNIWFVRHLPPSLHPAFYCSSALTLNITRAAMAEMGYCPSGRLFEAAACGTPIVSDTWPGLAEFFDPGREIITASNSDDVLQAMQLDADARRRIGQAARKRTLAEHSATQRARELTALLERGPAGRAAPAYRELVIHSRRT